MSEEHGSWDCGVTLKAIRDGGITWSIAVPAIQGDRQATKIRQALDRSVEEALRVNDKLMAEFPGGRRE